MWFNEILTQNEVTILFMFHSMTDVLHQSQFRSQKVYVILFAKMLPYKLKQILPKITSQDIIRGDIHSLRNISDISI